MKRYHLSIAVMILLLLNSCGGGGNRGDAAQSGTGEGDEKIVRVRVEEVVPEMVEQHDTFTATIEAYQKNNIVPALGGRIRKIFVDVGSSVSKGQRLVEMDDANLSQQQTQLATLERDYNRYKELYEVGGISKQQLDQLTTQLEVSKTAIRSLEENTILTSPVSGFVTARNYDPGDMVSQFPILTIEDISRVKVKVNVSEKYYSLVSNGMEVEVMTDAFGGEVFKGRVALIHPTLDPISHTFTVEVEVSNGDRRLRPGMFARVKMVFGTVERPLVPDLAVMKQPGSNDRYLFVIKDGKAVYTNVKLGMRIGDKFEVVSGLNARDRVVINGQAELIDGDLVEVLNS